MQQSAVWAIASWRTAAEAGDTRVDRFTTAETSAAFGGATVAKLKDDETGEQFKFTLTQIPVAYDEATGKDITSCVVMGVSEKEAFARERERQGHNVRPSEAKILINFFEAKKKYGIMVPYDDPNYPSAAWGKTVVRWSEGLEPTRRNDGGAHP